MKRIVLYGLIALLFFLLSTKAYAQTSFPMIFSTFPLAVERGKTSDVTVNADAEGANLYGAYKVMFDDSHLSAQIVPPEKGWPPIDPKNPDKIPQVRSVTMRVTVASDAPLGLHEFRIATPHFGISTVGQLYVARHPIVLQQVPNYDIEHAQRIEIPCDVDGVINSPTAFQFYRFHANAGQQVVFTILCARAENKIHGLQQHADPILALCTPDGVEIAENDDYYGPDSLLAYRFEKSGDYLLKVRDVNYDSNPHWVFHLIITTAPYVVAVTPCAVTAGQTATLNVEGYNLGDTKTVTLSVPSNLPDGIWNTPLSFPNGESNPVKLLVTHLPVTTIEASAFRNGSDSPLAGAKPITVPCYVCSWIASANQLQSFTFHATKGENWSFETTAERLDSRMDTMLRLFDAKGNKIAENDDAPGLGTDSHIDWTAPADGDYTIQVSDRTGQYGPNCYYALTIAPNRPDFALRLDPDRAMIAPGNRTAWFVLLDRKNGFNGPVTISIQGLPTGVSASPLTIPPGIGQGVILLSADAGAKQDAALLKVVGTAQIPIGPNGQMETVVKQAQDQTEIYIPGGGRGLYPVDTAGVAVTDPNDLTVTVANPNITLQPGGTAKIEVTIQRRSDYKQPVTLDLRVNHLGAIYTDPLPPGVHIESDAVTVPADQNKGVITIKADDNAPPISNWPLAVMANVSVNFVMKVWYAAPIFLTVEPKPGMKK